MQWDGISLTRKLFLSFCLHLLLLAGRTREDDKSSPQTWQNLPFSSLARCASESRQSSNKFLISQIMQNSQAEIFAHFTTLFLACMPERRVCEGVTLWHSQECCVEKREKVQSWDVKVPAKFLKMSDRLYVVQRGNVSTSLPSVGISYEKKESRLMHLIEVTHFLHVSLWLAAGVADQFQITSNYHYTYISVCFDHAKTSHRNNLHSVKPQIRNKWALLRHLHCCRERMMLFQLTFNETPKCMRAHMYFAYEKRHQSEAKIDAFNGFFDFVLWAHIPYWRFWASERERESWGNWNISTRLFFSN